MRKTFLFINLAILLFAALPVSAQLDSVINLPNFLLPNFTRSILKFKDGGENKVGMLNYNLVDQEMVFQQPDSYMVLDNPEVIDTVYMAGKKFVPFDKAFYEVVLEGSMPMYIQHKSNAEPQGVTKGYGLTSQTSGGQYQRQIYGSTGVINLSVPDNFKLVDDSYYWVKKDGTMQKFNNKKQFLKIFSDNEKDITQFIDKNSLSFKKLNDIIKVVEYCITLKK
jgi:hypothetical protein